MDEQLSLLEEPDYEGDLADLMGWMDKPQVMLGKTIPELLGVDNSVEKDS